MKNEYEINKGTLAVISMEDGKTKILEDSQDYIIPCSSYDILAVVMRVGEQGLRLLLVLIINYLLLFRII